MTKQQLLGIIEFNIIKLVFTLKWGSIKLFNLIEKSTPIFLYHTFNLLLHSDSEVHKTN